MKMNFPERPVKSEEKERFGQNRAVSQATSKFFFKRLIVGVLLINVFVASIVWLSMHNSKLQYREGAAVTARNLSHVLEEYIKGDLNKIDIAMLAAADEVERMESAKGHIDRKALNTYLARLQLRVPEVNSLRVADAQGIVQYGLGVVPAAHVNVSDRAYFIRQRDDAKAGLVLQTPPIFARVSKKWSVPASRRFNKPDGSFAGVVYVNISLDHLAKILAVADTGKQGVVTIFDDQFGIIARQPEPEEIDYAVGKKLVSPKLTALIQQGLFAASYDTNSSVDGIERTFSYKKVSDYPLYVVVGLAMDDYLAQWRDAALKEAALVILFFWTTVILAWFVWRARLRYMEQSLMLIHQSRLAAMGEMIQSIAHQWRQPLYVLELLVRNLRHMSAAGTLDKKAVEDETGDMMVQVRGMSTTIDDFRDFFKPDRSRQDFALQDAIDHTLVLVGRVFYSHCINIHVEKKLGVYVSGYQNELNQVLLNVMNNAKDALLEAELSNGEMLITTGSDDKNGWITILDNAGGIPKAILPKIFTPYFSSKKTGAGIGLCMSKMIMEHMGGEISARNIDGGAAFTIFLPLSKRLPDKAAEPNLAMSK